MTHETADEQAVADELGRDDLIAQQFIAATLKLAIAHTVQGALSLQRDPSRGDTTPPPPGAWCSNCYRTTWWTERSEPKGWRCIICHPPDHLRSDQVWINDQPAPPVTPSLRE